MGVVSEWMGAVDVEVLLVAVRVAVYVEPATFEVPKDLDPQQHQHGPNAELEHGCGALEPVEEYVLEQQDKEAQGEERCGVSEARGRTDPDAAPCVTELTGDGRDGYDVVGIGGVLEPQQKAKGQRDPRSGFEVHTVTFTVPWYGCQALRRLAGAPGPS